MLLNGSLTDSLFILFVYSKAKLMNGLDDGLVLVGCYNCSTWIADERENLGQRENR